MPDFNDRTTSSLRELEDLLAKGMITRRDFLGRAAALGVVVSVAGSLWDSSALAHTPKKGGRFRVGLSGGQTGDSMDPARISSAMPQNINWQNRNNLVEVDYEYNIVPELAESWEPTPDAASWTFKLREGVEFRSLKSGIPSRP